MNRRLVTVLAAVAVLAGLAVGAPATAAASAPGLVAVPARASGLGAVPAPVSGLVAALARDLDLSVEQAVTRLGQERRAERIAGDLRGRLASFAGSWFDPATGSAVVGVTEPAEVATVRATGATPRLLRHSHSALAAAKAELDARQAPPEVTSFHVDEPGNRVVVTALPGGRAAAERFAAGAGAVQVVESASAPATTGDLAGGGAIYLSGAAGGRCSAGFTARTADGQPRLLTAGHCADGGSLVNGLGNVKIGEFSRVNWKDQNDFAEVTVDPAAWTLLPQVSTHDGGAVTIKGAERASVGASLCKSGATSKWTCGVVTARDVTVKYGQIDGSTITVHGLVQHNACVEPGDSGGSNVSGDQAQGITSGAELYDANGDGRNESCLAKRGEESVSWYQPVDEVLATYRLTLATG
ncbi:S1 family peptidase [Crossiella sp. CA-258035]|uniref:S1 family peptidase n=1 Tax=Crossiella sp. CA-258035 TaxID=2981138 RepID=UPI0024BCE6B5|nr:S1 family peptidase [Crossiella sp. CA-258035]WHT19938.1 S1 family peptidase [Crossiella sp. CA-258035]